MTSSNLVPLLNQLQLMENTLTNFMLETILKLQSLTDVKVFLMIDSNATQSRRYCGSEELIHAFESQGGLLCDRKTDVAVRLDSSVNSLVESVPNISDLSYSDDFQASCDEVVGLSPSSTPSTKSHKKRSTNSMVPVYEGATAPKRNRVENSSAREPHHSVKDEYIDRVKEIPEYVINDDEEDEDVVTSSFLLDDSSMEVSHSSNNATDLFISQRSHTSSASVQHHPHIDPRSFFGALNDPELELVKYNSLMKIHDPVMMYQRDTVESKLMKSVCYGVGKNAARICPLEFTEENKSAITAHWSHHCDLFVGQCENAGLLVEKTPQNTALLNLIPKNSCVGFIRQCIRDGFKKVAYRHQNKNT